MLRTIRQMGASMTQRQGRDWGLALPARLAFPAMLMLVALLRYVSPIGDPDTFWHVRTGHWIRDAWQFHGPDPFTRTATVDWTLHEWIPELAMSVADDVWGMRGLIMFKIVSLALLMLTIYWVCRQRSSILVAGFVTGATVAAMSSSISPRPQMLTFVLTLLAVHGWLASAQDGRPRWWLVALSWVWASSHGMWFVGVMVGIAVVLGSLLDRAGSRRWFGKAGLILLCQVAAAAAGPAGWHVLTAPLRVSATTALISEWRPASLMDVAFAIFVSLAGLVVILWSRRTERVTWRALMLLALSAGLALIGVRLVAVGAAVLAPVAASAIEEALEYRRERVSSTEVAATSLGILLGIAGALLLVASMARPVSWGPAGLVDELATVPPGATVCNSYGLGGWLLYVAPNLLPVVDGRSEIYAPTHVATSMAMESGAGWREFADTHDCSVALLDSDAPAIELFTAVGGWTPVATADGYTLLRRP
ncbi:hypothetical protein [Ornithinimicrobium tianjinense]|uniref:Uncharacterized protein n=1 Tax=Ornithinimicrobium tianjinense TaxID=1195761 RepID=A0A917BID9_9MICO|nr:hypothetical protein [Ornithinimicrobium tianjinense]GGF44614.1 hypothetical protein GCM10011366_10440 [Ornithinimicrobium tianjinense]